MRPIHAFGDRDEHFLGVATAQSAGAAIGHTVNAGDFPACSRCHPGNAVATGSCPDHYQIIIFRGGHRILLSRKYSSASLSRRFQHRQWSSGDLVSALNRGARARVCKGRRSPFYLESCPSPNKDAPCPERPCFQSTLPPLL